MGSETILPGTALSDIPLQDQPNFSAASQNGFQSGPASPVPTGLVPGVTKQTFAGSSLAGNVPAPAVGSPVFGHTTLASGANIRIDTLIGAFAPGANGTLIIQANGPFTAPGSVFLGNAADNLELDVGKAGSLIIPEFFLQTPVAAVAPLFPNFVFNSDAAAQLVKVSFNPKTDAWLGRGLSSVSLDMSSRGLVVRRIDALRIRELQLIFFPSPGSALQGHWTWADSAEVRLMTGPLVGNNYPVIASRVLRRPFGSLELNWPAGLGGNNGIVVYALQEPWSLLGQDSDANGASNQANPLSSWSPFFWFLYELNDWNGAVGGIQFQVRFIIELFLSANPYPS